MAGVDVRRELKHMWKEYDRYYRVIGEEVIWFRFDTVESRYDDVYDEGGLTYLPGIRMPVLWIDQIEDPEQYSGEGRRPTQRVRFAVSSKTMRARGISTFDAHGAGVFPTPVYPPDPLQPGREGHAAWLDDRLNDVIYYDGRFYAVSNFQIRGRTPQGDVIVGVAGLEQQMDEFNLDLFPWNTPYATTEEEEHPDTNYEVYDLVLDTADDLPFSLVLDVGVDLTGSEWEAKIFLGDPADEDVVATLTVIDTEQSEGLLEVRADVETVTALIVSDDRYTWSLTQIYEEELPNVVLRGDVEVR